MQNVKLSSYGCHFGSGRSHASSRVVYLTAKKHKKKKQTVRGSEIKDIHPVSPAHGVYKKAEANLPEYRQIPQCLPTLTHNAPGLTGSVQI